MPRVVGDITEIADLIGAIDTHSVDRIIHTAGMLGAAVRARPLAGLKVNLLGTANVLEAARLTKQRRFVYCGSASVAMGQAMADTGDVPLVEDVATRLVSEAPLTVYALTKIGGEWLSHLYRRSYGVDTVAVRLGGVFGPWHGLLTGQPNKLIHTLVAQASASDTILVGPSDYALPGIDYVHAADCAQGLVRALLAEEPTARVYNVSMGRTYGVDEIVEVLAGLVGRTLTVKVEGEPTAMYGSRAVTLDITRAQKELGFQVEFPMERGLTEYLDWVKAQ